LKALLGGWIAQLVEQRTENPRVGGSIPPPATTFKNPNRAVLYRQEELGAYRLAIYEPEPYGSEEGKFNSNDL
jgi:hypothetical protein